MKSADAFRAHETAAHAQDAEPLLAEWLRSTVPALARQPVAAIEDRVWHAVVTLAPYPDIKSVLSRLVADGVRLAALSNAGAGISPILFWPSHREPPPPTDVPVVRDWRQFLALYVATISA